MQIINDLYISNYKSIRELHLECSRINVFVGEPNVGKSNILEAIDLSFLPSMLNINSKVIPESDIDVKRYFRADDVANLFHLGDLSKPISVRNSGLAFDIELKYLDTSPARFELKKSDGGFVTIDNEFRPLSTQYFGSPIKPYRYLSTVTRHDDLNFIDKLMPPFGNNLHKVIQYNKDLQDTFGNILADQGWELNVVINEKKMLIQRYISKGIIFTLPWEALADTLKIYFFYLAAIRHNNASVVTLEEPEVHSFPRFISSIGDAIIETSERQFFIATHSPYLLTNLIENTPETDLSVFACSYDKEQSETKARKLTRDELSELLDFGVDIFFNINRYVTNGTEHRP